MAITVPVCVMFLLCVRNVIVINIIFCVYVSYVIDSIPASDNVYDRIIRNGAVWSKHNEEAMAWQ